MYCLTQRAPPHCLRSTEIDVVVPPVSEEEPVTTPPPVAVEEPVPENNSSCPDGCTSFFDGCNTCMCSEGRIMGCTKKACRGEMEEPRCLAWEGEEEEEAAATCPDDCVTWFDGCNYCSCEEGKVSGCTKMLCHEQDGEPRCTRRRGEIGEETTPKPPTTQTPPLPAEGPEGCTPVVCPSGFAPFVSDPAACPGKNCCPDACLPEGKCSLNCEAWYDGCNSCGCTDEGQISVCTKRHCFRQGEAYCERVAPMGGAGPTLPPFSDPVPVIEEPPSSPDCAAVTCLSPTTCAAGERLETPEGECCPRCVQDCGLARCLMVECAEGELKETPKGECCPRCKMAIMAVVPSEPEISTMSVPAPAPSSVEMGGMVEEDVASVDCALVSCERPSCPQGVVAVVPEGQCCPVCPSEAPINRSGGTVEALGGSPSTQHLRSRASSAQH
uniref:Antistasin-like domain-containing protein n=1 Tax=Chromera velia CCMP2878 TaxID=1169474 RepID=A0A0G4HD85_9ALVE|eukprot:Cvel_26216.t1-p1 / transcript=Cvel_26216.t1 / gene=Cvel_26216 / organism=Chromera_velia_CCMP2878 / gene_product=Extracellular matrix protein FRAS1, putative / transcript_product=Extracellular matrix protein FRAS1, putative / location=Cvel_scaffold3089:1580-4045(+) / protein_length=439 / sequence_SO=supercontig / SO=protein_coding / is_pseudo=false